jgi:type II restriction enzyme
VTRGIATFVSASTARRWLAQDTLKPWQHRSWIFITDPDFRAKAQRVLDLYARTWQDLPLGEDEYVISADEKTSIQARCRCHPTLAPGQAEREDVTHTEVQGWLRDLGRALGSQVWIAANDRNRQYQGARLADGCLIKLPAALTEGPAGEAISLIDVLWLEPEGKVAAAFEVEHTTSIYSGIVRMLDLALSGDLDAAHGMYLVAPDAREDEVRAQIRRPAFSRVADLPYGELRANREAIARFGRGLHPIEALTRDLG